MKKFIVLIIVVFCISGALNAQMNTSKSNLTGTWTASSFYFPTIFSYNKENKEIILTDLVKKRLLTDADGSLKKSVDDLKTQVPGQLDGMFFTLNEDNTFSYVAGGKYSGGTYSFGDPASFMSASSPEKNFLDFVHSYGYIKVIHLTEDPSGDKTDFYIDAAKNSIVFSPEKTGFNINTYEVSSTSISFKKADAATAALLLKKTAEAKTATNNKKMAGEEAEVAAERKKKADYQAANEKILAEDEQKNGKIYYTADKEPVYPGGYDSWNIYVKAHLNARVPLDYGALPGAYTAIVSFTVNTDGSISNIINDNELGLGMGQEAVRVVTRSAHWEPAQQAGNKVRFRMKKKIFFVVKDE
jgi:hypothetical protein